MKKVFSLLAVLALVCMAGTAFAAFTPVAKTAIATFEGGDINFNVTFYQWTGNYEGDTAKDNLEWNNPEAITIAKTTADWANSDVYALVNTNITTTGKVYMYTKNKDNSTTYEAKTGRGGEGQKVFNGLVRGNSKGGDAKNFAPIMYYSVSLATAKTSWASAQPPVHSQTYGNRYLVDYYDYNREENMDYMTIATSNGIWVGYGSSGLADYEAGDHVLFFEASFTNVLGGDTFGTNTITFNTSVE